MTLPARIAVLDLASPELLVVVLVNLAVGLVAGWLLARRRIAVWFRRSDQATSRKVQDVVSTLSGRVDRHLRHIQALRRDLTRLELAGDRRAQRILRSLERTIRPLEGELKAAARRLRRNGRARDLPPSEVQRTSTTLADSVQTHRADVEHLRDQVFGHITDEKNRLAEIVRALEQLLRTLDQHLASTNQDLTILVKQSESIDRPDGYGLARPPTDSPAMPDPDETSDPSSADLGDRSQDRPSASDLQQIRALTRQVADKRHQVERENRSHRRWNLAMPVVAVPLDDSHQPIGEPASMITRDISTSGISLLHTQPVPSGFLRVQLDAPILQSTELIVRVVRCRTIGVYTEIAGEFVARIDANERSAGSEPAVSHSPA